jgi:hypothetical protein
MAVQKPWLFTVFVAVQAAHKAAFNDWYNRVHVPEIMACPGFLSSVRYEEVRADGCYMAMYELSGPEALESDAFGQARGWKEMQPVVLGSNNAVWTHLYTASPESAARGGGVPTLLRFNRSTASPEREVQFNQWYNEVHLPELLACPGWLSASRYEAVHGTPKYLAIYDLAGASALETPEYFKARGFKDMEPYVTEASSLTYRPIFSWVQDR